ncbi:MAG: metallophosphoesterase family protein [Verrucomicrobiales bacterium]
MPVRRKARRILVIPDVHHHVGNAEYWLRTMSYDQVVFLGDYFDDFGDSPQLTQSTAAWIREHMLAQPDWVFLLGNHDLAYLADPDDRVIAPGFTLAKRQAMEGELPRGWLSRFRLGHWAAPDLLLSHAGLHPGWLRRQVHQEAASLIEQAEQDLARSQYHQLLSWGQDRGGLSSHQRVGGILWMDWGSLIPLSFCHQIVGHTPGWTVRHKTHGASVNLCLDVRNAEVAAMISQESGESERLVRVYQRAESKPELMLEHSLPRLLKARPLFVMAGI